MRIRHLEVEQFGIFTGHEMAFTGDSLQVIYGPNEAGKSTLLQLIRELLFGFAVRNPYAFADHASEVAAVATLEISDGARIRFRRRKGRRNEVVGEDLDTGLPIDALALNRLLGDASAELFQNVFGFSLAELTAGQQSLEHARLSEALYGGALGGLAGFRQVLDGLEKEHEALFSPTATKKPINQRLAELRRQGKELRAAQVRPRDYGQLDQEVNELGLRVKQLRQDRDALQRQQTRCEQLVRAVALWRQRTLLLEEVEALKIPSEFPRDGERQFEQCRAVRDQAAGELDDFRQELSDVCTHLDALAPQADVIDNAAKIQQLAQQLEKIRGFRHDIVLRQQESQTVKSAVLAALRELDPTWTLEHLQRFQTSIARRASVAAMQEELDGLHQRQRELLAQRPPLEADIAGLRRQLESLPAELVASPLADLVELAAEHEGRLEKREQYQLQLREQISRLESLQRKLNAPFGHQLGDLPQLPVPMTATVTEHRQRFVALKQQLEHGRARRDRAQAELEQRRQELDALQSQDPVPDREQLNKARQRRDRGWDLVRGKYVDGEPVTEAQLADWIGDAQVALPTAYQESVRNADRVADTRQQQAEAVARLDQLAREVVKARHICEQEARAFAACAAALDSWRRQWAELWRPTGIEPEEPDAMLDWLRLHGELVDVVAQVDAIQGHQDAQRQWIEQYESKLFAGLPGVSESPAALIAEARRRVQQTRDVAAERKSYAAQLPRKEHQLATLEQELAELNERCRQWQTRWQPLMDEFGFPASWDVHTATKVLSGLSDVRIQQREAESLDVRVHDMRQGIDQFEREVATLCQTLAPHLSERPAENAVEELGQMLDQARQQLRDQQTLLQQRTKLELRCERKQKQLEKEQAALVRLLSLAGVQREEELPAMARHVQRWFQMTDELETVEHQLRAIRGDEDKTLFEAALSDADQAALESQQRILESDLERIDQQFSEALQAQGVASKKLQELDQASQAAVLAQDIESTRSQLVETVDRWVPLVLARAFMVRALERFQREHQPRMLVDVSRLLQQMTLGRYTEISRKLDEQGSLQLHQEDGKLKEPHQLSTGTREQLYLAIRLAYALHYCREAEPLPIVMDDVLVNFDDRRAAATLEALLEVSQHVQVILLTCHVSTVDMVRSRLSQLEPILLGA